MKKRDILAVNQSDAKALLTKVKNYQRKTEKVYEKPTKQKKLTKEDVYCIEHKKSFIHNPGIKTGSENTCLIQIVKSTVKSSTRVPFKTKAEQRIDS
jgi:hypothetical protein